MKRVLMLAGLLGLLPLAMAMRMQLRVREAGTKGKTGPLLMSGMKFCPRDFSARGFSIECITPPAATRAVFAVNGKFQRREQVTPYMITGDQNGMVYPWNTYSPGMNVVGCAASTGDRVTVKFYIDCKGDAPMDKPEMPTPSMKPEMPEMPTPSMKPVVPEMPETNPDMPVDKPEMRPPPPMEPEVPETKPEMPDKKPDMPVDKPDSPPPPPPMEPEVPETKPEIPVKKPMPEQPEENPRSPPVSGGSCTTIPATSYVGSLSKGWEKVNGGLFYKKNDPFEGVVPSDTARINYKFTAPVTSKYAFVLDMTTSHPTEHNDCFVSIAGGWTLHRNGKTRSASGFTKAYHNKNGRARQAFSVDNDPHSFATMEIKAGETVDIVVGARSTKMGYHYLILFPCSGNSCDYTSPAWSSGLSKCK